MPNYCYSGRVTLQSNNSYDRIIVTSAVAITPYLNLATTLQAWAQKGEMPQPCSPLAWTLYVQYPGCKLSPKLEWNPPKKARRKTNAATSFASV